MCFHFSPPVHTTAVPALAGNLPAAARFPLHNALSAAASGKEEEEGEGAAAAAAAPHGASTRRSLSLSLSLSSEIISILSKNHRHLRPTVRPPRAESPKPSNRFSGHGGRSKSRQTLRWFLFQ